MIILIIINGNKLEPVKQFCYLGSMITEDCRCHVEIKGRIAMGKEAFNKRGELLTWKLQIELKKRMIKVLIWSVVLYGSETWTLTKDDIKWLEAFEILGMEKYTENLLDRMQNQNEEVLNMVNEERKLMETIRKRQKNWIGRRGSLLTTVLDGRIQGKKVPGRPRIMMLD